MFAAVAAFAAASCAQELENPQLPAGETVTFEASVDGAETKAVLDKTVSKWEKGDKITIHNGTKGYEFTTQDEGVKANFSYTGDDFSGEKFMAVYPAGNYTADVEAKTVTVNVPTYQPSRDNNFSVGSVPSIAYTENQTLSFKNASALLKFTVKGKNVKGLVFFGNNGEAVSGNVNVTLDADNKIKSLQAIETTITENDVTETKLITWAKVWADTKDYCFVEGTTYYLSVVPQKFSKGFGVELEIDGVGLEKVKNLETAYDLKPNTILNLGELEYVAPAPSNSWGIVGTMTSWGEKADIAMILEGDWYVAKEVTIRTTDEFKFRTDGKWGNERACNDPVAADKEVSVAAGAGNIKVAASAVYDVYLSKNADKMKLAKVADVEGEEPKPVDPSTYTWGICGDMNNWTGDVAMTLEGDWFVAKNLDVASGQAFKFRANGNWDVNRGATGDVEPYTVKADEVVTVEHNGKNLTIAAGTYNLYLSKDCTKVKAEVVGGGVPETPEVTPGQTSEWALVGVFSSWADKSFVTTEVANVVVCKSVAMKAAEGFLVRKPATDWADKYGAGNVNYLKTNHYITTSKDGADMCLESDGTYDIYFNTSTKALYVMAAGKDYATATLQTASGKEPVQEEPEVTEKVIYLKPNSNWKQSNARFAIYVWGGTAGEKWVSMTDADKDGIYEAHIPEGYDYGCNIIFCRMNPSTTANNWNNKWNQSSDLKTPTDGNNLYTVKAGTWDKGGGTWSKK